MARISTNEFNTRLTATDATQSALNNAKKGLVDYEKKNKSIAQRMTETWKKHWLAFTAAAYGAIRVIQGAWRLLSETAAFQEQVRAVDALGKQYEQTGFQIVKSVQAASRGLLTLKESANLAATGLRLGLDPAIINRFVAVAETMTDVTGEEIPEAFDKMINAAVSGRQQSLKLAGVFLDMNQVYEEHAKKIGKTVDKLDEQEKMQASVNAVLAFAEKKYKDVATAQDTYIDSMQRITTEIEDMKLRGGFALQYIVVIIKFIIEVIQLTVVTAINWVVKYLKWCMDRMADLTYKMAELADHIPGIGDAVALSMRKTAASMDTLFEHTANVVEEWQKNIRESAEKTADVLRNPQAFWDAQMNARASADAQIQANNEVAENHIANEGRKREAELETINWRLEQGQYQADLQVQRRQEEQIYHDQHLQTLTDAEHNYMMNEGNMLDQITAQVMDNYDQRANTITNYYTERIANATTAAEEQTLLEQYEQEMHAAMTEAKRQIDETYAQSALSMTVQLFAALAGESRAFFETWKALAIAETIISTLRSAVDAFLCWASTGNPVGYAMGIVAAALALATGYARVQEIRNTDYTGKHTGGYIGGTEEEPIYKLQRGEYVVSRTGVQTLDRLNAGEDIGFGNVNVNFNVNTNDPITFEKYLINNKRSVSKSIWQTVRNNENRF